MDGLPVSLSGFPDAEMSLRQYEDFVFRAGSCTWMTLLCLKELSVRQQRLADYLNGKEEIRVSLLKVQISPLGVDQRLWLNSDGKKNFPDGEVFTGPIESATKGWFVIVFLPFMVGVKAMVSSLRLKTERWSTRRLPKANSSFLTCWIRIREPGIRRDCHWHELLHYRVHQKHIVR